MNATRIIKVFLASSITELKKERFDLSDLGNDIANLFSQDDIAIRFVKCENMHFGNIGEDDQKAIDEMLRRCEMSLFLFKTKAGEWTAHEFEVAKALQKQKLHRMFVYFINTPDEEKDKSLGEFQERLKKENIFWKEYDNVLEVKFSFAMGVLNHLGITVGDGTPESESIARDLDSRFEQYKKNEQQQLELRKYIHQDIEDLLAQKDAILADKDQTVASRIVKVNELYKKADDIAAATAYDKEKYANLLSGYARFLYKHGLYKDSEAIWLRQIPLVEELHSTKSEEAAISYNNIGSVYWKQGNYDKALEYYFKALDIYEKVLGTEHSFTATSYNNIGSVYHEQGNYDKALEYYFKALPILEKNLGSEHSSTASSYNNIGSVYQSKEDYNQAMKYHSKALTIREKVLGTEHFDTANSFNNIGLLYCKQGNYDEALKYHFKALAIRKNVLGFKHTDTARSYNNIGLAYYMKALAIMEDTLRTKHKDNTRTYNSIVLANNYFDKALRYYFKALTIWEEVLLKEHPDIATSYHNIGILYYTQGDYNKALGYLNKAYQIRLKVLGPELPDTKATLEWIELVQEVI